MHHRSAQPPQFSKWASESAWELELRAGGNAWRGYLDVCWRDRKLPRCRQLAGSIHGGEEAGSIRGARSVVYIWRWAVVGGAGKRGWIAGQGWVQSRRNAGGDSDAEISLPDLSLALPPSPPPRFSIGLLRRNRHLASPRLTRRRQRPASTGLCRPASQRSRSSKPKRARGFSLQCAKRGAAFRTYACEKRDGGRCQTRGERQKAGTGRICNLLCATTFLLLKLTEAAGQAGRDGGGGRRSATASLQHVRCGKKVLPLLLLSLCR
jgi:hypothetical protein